MIKELFRKSIHICSAFIPLLLSFNKPVIIALLVLALVIYTISELLRLKGIKTPIVSQITEFAERKRDKNRFSLGPVTLVIGIIITALLLPPENTRIGIFALAFGDGLASIGGKLFGHVEIPFTHGKTLAGSITCWLGVFISCFCVTKNLYTSLILATAAMVLEALPLRDMDNVLIPVAIGSLSLLFV